MITSSSREIWPSVFVICIAWVVSEVCSLASYVQIPTPRPCIFEIKTTLQEEARRQIREIFESASMPGTMMPGPGFSSFPSRSDRREYATLPPIHEAIPEIRRLPRIQPKGVSGRPLTPLAEISPPATRSRGDLPSPEYIFESGHNRCPPGPSQAGQAFVGGGRGSSQIPRSAERPHHDHSRSDYHSRHDSRHDPHHRIGFPSPSSPAVALPAPQSRTNSGRTSPYGETHTPSPIQPPTGFLTRDDDDPNRYPGTPYGLYDRREIRSHHRHGISSEPSLPSGPFGPAPNSTPRGLGGRENGFPQPVNILNGDRHPNRIHSAHLTPYSPTDSVSQHHTPYHIDSFGLRTRQKTKPRKRRGNLPKWATDILRQWFLEHIEHAYPTEEEKKALGLKTSLSINQISNWFINARRRQLPNLTKDANTVSIVVRNMQGAGDQVPSPAEQMEYGDDDDVLDSDTED